VQTPHVALTGDAANAVLFATVEKRLCCRCVDQQWGERYPMIAKSWRASWPQLTAFLDFPPELRRMVYTTNAIESLNYQLRKIIKTKGHFPDEDSTTKVLFLALRNIEKKWGHPVTYWHRILNQLIIFFGDERLNVATRESARAQNL
jgi:transposase-like protein